MNHSFKKSLYNVWPWPTFCDSSRYHFNGPWRTKNVWLLLAARLGRHWSVDGRLFSRNLATLMALIGGGSAEFFGGLA